MRGGRAGRTVEAPRGKKDEWKRIAGRGRFGSASRAAEAGSWKAGRDSVHWRVA